MYTVFELCWITLKKHSSGRSLEGYPILQRKVSRVYSVTIFKYYNKSVTEYHIPLTDVYLYTV